MKWKYLRVLEWALPLVAWSLAGPWLLPVDSFTVAAVWFLLSLVFGVAWTMVILAEPLWLTRIECRLLGHQLPIGAFRGHRDFCWHCRRGM